MEETTGLTTLAEIAAMESFGGFSPDDFTLFDAPEFADRMSLLREQVTPKLFTLGAILTPRLSETLGETLYPHVAQHLRRTVNAPIETWVAFARSPRAYKPSAHLRIAVSGTGVRIVVFVEDDAADKALFAASLARNAEPFAAFFTHHAALLAYDIRDAEGEPRRGSALDAETLTAFAERLNRVKGQHAAFGLHFASTHPVLASGPEFVEAVVAAARVLKPLYDCGITSDYDFIYTPEIIPGI